MVAVPFVSQAQRAYMYANHPQLAAKWERLTPKDQGLPKKLGQKHPTNPRTESEETWKPAVQRLERKPGSTRDFGMLHPSAAARFSPKAGPVPNQLESDKEDGVQYLHGSRHREFGAPQAHKGLRARDTKVAFGHPNVAQKGR